MQIDIVMEAIQILACRVVSVTGTAGAAPRRTPRPAVLRRRVGSTLVEVLGSSKGALFADTFPRRSPKQANQLIY